MSFSLWLAYLGAVVILSLTPGPNGLLALSQGMTIGVGRACYTIMGGVIGFGLMMLLTILGVGSFIIGSPALFMGLKIFGALYLIYLGIQQWRSPSDFQVQTSGHAGEKTGLSLFSQGFLVATSNPKVILFYLAFLPQFIIETNPILIQFVILAITFMAVEFLVELGFAGFAGALKGRLTRPNVYQWVNRLTGLLFILIGIGFGVSAL